MIRSRLTGTGAPAGTHDVELPPDARPGDRVNVGFVNDHAHATAAASSGWSSLGSDVQGTTTNHRLTVFTRVLDGGADDELTVTITDTTDGNARAAAWDVFCHIGDAGTPVAEFANGGGNTGATGTATVDPITRPAGDYDSLIFLGLDNSDGETHTVTPPEGWGNLQTAGVPADPVLAYAMDWSRVDVTGFAPGDISFTAQEQWITAHVVVPSIATESRRFYLANLPAAWKPGTASSWLNDASEAANARQLTEEPTGDPDAVTVTETSSTDPWWMLLGQWTSHPASEAGALSISFDFAAGFRESAAAANMTPVLTVWVSTGDTDVRRGTAIFRFFSQEEFPTTATGIALSPATTLAGENAVEFAAGDRLVLEVAARAANGDTTPYDGTVHIGGTDTPDLADGVTDMGRPGWLQLRITPGVVFEQTALELEGELSAASSAGGAVSVARALQGSTAAADSAAAALSVVRRVSGTGAGASSAGPAPLRRLRSFAGELEAASAAAGALSRVRRLAGTAAAASSATGELLVLTDQSFAGTLAGASAATGELTVARSLAGELAASSAATGALTVGQLRALAGALAASSAAEGFLTVLGEETLAGDVAAASSATGALTVLRDLAGVLAAAAAGRGELHVEAPPRRLPEPGGALPPPTSGWRPDPPSTYRPPTVVYLDA